MAAAINAGQPTAEIIVRAEDLLQFINRSREEEQAEAHITIRQIFAHLNQNPLQTENTLGDFTYVNWLSHLEMREEKIYAQFTPRVAAYFLKNQSDKHTRLLEDLQPFKSKFTAALIRLFEQHEPEPRPEIEFSFSYDLSALKEYFAVTDKYRRFFDFERFVLAATQQELDENDILPYWFSFDKIKQGRNIKDIHFTVYLRPKVLLDLRPQLRADRVSSPAQRDIFDEQRAGSFNREQQRIFSKLTGEEGIGKAFTQQVLSRMNESEAQAYYSLIRFGIAKTRAFTFVKKYLRNSEDILKTVRLKIEETKKKADFRKGKNETLLLEKLLRE